MRVFKAVLVDVKGLTWHERIYGRDRDDAIARVLAQGVKVLGVREIAGWWTPASEEASQGGEYDITW